VANLVAAKLASARTRNEIEWAAYIQRTLLESTPPRPPGYDVAVRLVPCEAVGGDLYETLELPDGRFLYALGDIVGKGVGAALLMTNVLATLRALARTTRAPLQLAGEMQQSLDPQLGPHGFVTLFLGILDGRTHRLDYVNAGHEPPVLFAPGHDAQPLAATGPPVGMRIPVPLGADTVELAPGATLCVWSDGITEAVRVGTRPLEDFGRARTLARLEALRDAAAETIVADLFASVDAFVGGRHAQDDRTMLVLRRLP
jgi:sigma-B regulation protein RsbU (phosphoserine phosphatase)